MTDTPSIARGARVLVAVCALIAAAASCAARRPAPSAAPDAVLTVQELVDMARNGAPPSVMYAEVQRTGTVYRLTPDDTVNMRSAGVPASLLSNLELTYEHAVRTNPALATSNAQWHEIGGFWYGGTPFGWPREWVVGAPPLGAPLRRLE